MSYKGQVLRGEKWFNLYRDADGNLLPNISEDENKMVDVNAYLESKKKVEETKKKDSKEKK